MIIAVDLKSTFYNCHLFLKITQRTCIFLTSFPGPMIWLFKISNLAKKYTANKNTFPKSLECCGLKGYRKCGFLEIPEHIYPLGGKGFHLLMMNLMAVLSVCTSSWDWTNAGTSSEVAAGLNHKDTSHMELWRSEGPSTAALRIKCPYMGFEEGLRWSQVTRIQPGGSEGQWPRTWPGSLR